jgi:hypothetical protein
MVCHGQDLVPCYREREGKRVWLCEYLCRYAPHTRPLNADTGHLQKAKKEEETISQSESVKKRMVCIATQEDLNHGVKEGWKGRGRERPETETKTQGPISHAPYATSNFVLFLPCYYRSKILFLSIDACPVRAPASSPTPLPPLICVCVLE